VACFEVLVDQSHGHRTFADGRRDPFDRAAAHVAGREDAGQARLEQRQPKAVAIAVPRRAGGTGLGEDETVIVERDLVTEPAGMGLRADEDEQCAARDRAALAGLVVLDRGVISR